MNPWLIGGGAAVLLALLASSSSGGVPGQDAMLFVHYQWVTVLPTYTGPGGDLANPLASQLPPPPGVQSPGKWIPFPSGYYVPGTTNPLLDAQLVGPSSGTPVKTPTQMWGPQLGLPIAQGVTVWAWLPLIGLDSRGQANITKINGYWVTVARWSWHPVQPSATAPLGNGYAFAVQAQKPNPPPGETAQSGFWQMVRPAYAVWLTPTNQMAPGVVGADVPFTPGVPISPSQGFPSSAYTPGSGLPAPSPSPLTVTPPAQAFSGVTPGG